MRLSYVYNINFLEGGWWHTQPLQDPPQLKMLPTTDHTRADMSYAMNHDLRERFTNTQLNTYNVKNSRHLTSKNRSVCLCLKSAFSVTVTLTSDLKMQSVHLRRQLHQSYKFLLLKFWPYTGTALGG